MNKDKTQVKQVKVKNKTRQKAFWIQSKTGDRPTKTNKTLKQKGDKPANDHGKSLEENSQVRNSGRYEIKSDSELKRKKTKPQETVCPRPDGEKERRR